MEIRVIHIEDIAVVELEGRININSSKLIEAVGSIIDSGIRKIVIDMQNIDFIDYNGLSVVAIAYKSVLNQRGMMKLCNISLHILELLRIVKLDEVFEIYNSREEAVEAFKASKKAAKALKTTRQQLRRKFQRLELDIPVHYRATGKFQGKAGEQLFSGRIANISGAGIFIRTINMILPGTAVELDMILEFKKPLIIKGTVIWIADKDLQPDFYPGIGVAFENIPSRVQENIIEFIEKNTVHRSS